jgi:hypothetical protein
MIDSVVEGKDPGHEQRLCPKTSKLAIIPVLLVGFALGCMVVVGFTSANASSESVVISTRELTAYARQTNSDIENIRVYRVNNGPLLASWTEGGDIHCSDVRVVEPTKYYNYSTESVKLDSGKCATHHASVGIGR